MKTSEEIIHEAQLLSQEKEDIRSKYKLNNELELKRYLEEERDMNSKIEQFMIDRNELMEYIASLPDLFGIRRAA